MKLIKRTKYTIYTWGGSTYGLNFKTKQPHPHDQLVGKVLRADFGLNHGGLVTDDNQLYMIGSNKYGQLGIGNTTKDSEQFVLVDYFNEHSIKVKDVKVGSNHTIVLTLDGQVYSFGRAL